jgi:hypothetical protein
LSISIISNDFGDTFYRLLDNVSDEIIIISPFISFATAKRFAGLLVSLDENIHCKVITRFNRDEFIRGANSIEGLEVLIEAGAELYALQHLHTKLYIFDSSSVLMGSANFTLMGFFRNHEFGLCIKDEDLFIEQCLNYANDLLHKMGQEWIITKELIEKEKLYVNKAVKGRGRSDTEYNSIRWGAVLDREENDNQSVPRFNTDNYFDILDKAIKEQDDGLDAKGTGIWIKFGGNSENRVPNDSKYITRKKDLHEYIKRTYYPRQPKGVKAGDIIFIAVVSKDKHGNETPMIVGYAVANGFDSKNIITYMNKDYKKWNGRYPYYIEFSSAKFINQPIKEGISLISLCNTLKNKVYPSTIYNPNVSITELLKRHHQKAHIQITSFAKEYLMDKINDIFKISGYDEIK